MRFRTPLMLGGLVLVLFLTVACSSTPQPSTPDPATQKPPASDPKEPANGSPQPTPGSFQQLRPTDLPTELAGWTSTNAEAAGAVAQYVDGALYVMVSAGQQPTGGHHVTIESLTLQDGQALVTARLHKPAPGQMVTQVITYPTAFAKLISSGTGQPQVKLTWQ